MLQCSLGFLNPVVTLVFELEGKFRAAAQDDFAVTEHVNVSGLDVVQKALVMRHENHSLFGRHNVIDSVCHDAEGVNVEAGVRFVEETHLRIENRHLEDFVALLFATAHAVVHAAFTITFVHFEQIHLFFAELLEIFVAHFGLAEEGTLAVECHLQEFHVVHARNFGRVLRADKEAGVRAFVDFHFEQVLAVQFYGAAIDMVSGVPCNHFGERAFAGAVRAHDGVDFSRLDLEIDPFQDLGAVFDTCFKVLDG